MNPADNMASDPLSELARQRREEVARESVRPRPHFVQSVEQSEVIYTFDVAAIPFRQIDIVKLSEKLEEAYGVQIDGPDLSPLLSVMTREQLVNADESVLMRKLVRLPNTVMLRWTDGRFPLRDDFITVRQIALNFETIQVNVAGESEIAEVIAQETLETIWRLAGSKKSFERDLMPLLLMQAYGTRTRLQMGFGPEALLNPTVLDFFERNLTSGSKFAPHMGRRKPSGNRGVEGAIQAVAALDSLTIRVNRFDPESGYAQEIDLDFDVTGRSDYRTGRLSVTTPLPYDKHIQLLTELFEAITPSTQ